MVTGFYRFVQPGSYELQVDVLLSKINLMVGDILAPDWEDPEISGAWKDAWINRVQEKAPGHEVVLYCSGLLGAS
jgi:hypothetical protein